MKKQVDKIVEILEEKKNRNTFRSEELHKVALIGLAENSRELDKILLGLSVGSLGFLLTFLINNYSFNNDKFVIALGLFVFAVLMFGYTIYNILTIFYKNNEYFKEIIKFEEGQDSSPILDLEVKLNSYDKKVKISFFVSILFSALFIIAISVNKNIVEYKKENNKENIMLEKNVNSNHMSSKLVMVNDSASGLFKSSQAPTSQSNTSSETQGEKSASGLFSSSQTTSSNSNNNTSEK